LRRAFERTVQDELEQPFNLTREINVGRKFIKKLPPIVYLWMAFLFMLFFVMFLFVHVLLAYVLFLLQEMRRPTTVDSDCTLVHAREVVVFADKTKQQVFRNKERLLLML